MQQAPGIPCTLSFEGKGISASLGCYPRRENVDAYSVVVTRESGWPSIPETAMIEPIGRGVLDTRLRGYDDFVRGDHLDLIARSGSDEAIHASAIGKMDCFASLAMTGDRPHRTGYPVCVGYDDLLATRKILKAGSANRALPTPVTPM